MVRMTAVYDFLTVLSRMVQNLWQTTSLVSPVLLCTQAHVCCI